MHVIGTAGHVDHGKTSLVTALTGINPDRLKEEREREMTIDLGFAWLTLPGGEEIGIVDVPGHRDFIENMLAGIGGVDAALLVVAGDERGQTPPPGNLPLLDLPPDPRRPRLPIDRVFSMPGFGTVVTGTLLDGSLEVGDEIEILPDQLTGRV